MVSSIQYLFLKKFYHINTTSTTPDTRISLDKIFNDNFAKRVAGKFVIDFGCGHGGDTEAIAKWGAKLSLGLEIRDELVQNNLQRINLDNCTFATTLPAEHISKADMVISIDAFEHFDQPAEMLKIMFNCLRSGGEACIGFGPTWYHPLGGHAFSVFPWSHLIFSEKALIRWRNQFYHDGATRFHEVAGGLNKLSISSFEKIFKNSGFVVEEFYCKPIKGWRWLQLIMGRELTTSMVLVRLRKP